MSKKLAVFALTVGGAKLAQKIAESVPDTIHIYLPEKLKSPDDSKEHIKPYSGKLADKLGEVYRDREYHGFAMIMALGIVVRTFAPLISDKRNDPPVICLDEKGRYVISVISGHLGGANQLAEAVASAVGGQPVITTATDVNNKKAFDVLAKEYGFTIEPFSNLKFFNSALVHDEQIAIFIDRELPPEIENQFAQDSSFQVELFSQLCAVNPTNKSCIITSRTDARLRPKEDDHQVLFLRPKNLIVGIGCRRGTSKEELKIALEQGLGQINHSLASIKKLVSIDIKSDEVGLLQLAAEMAIPLEFISKERINELLAEESLSKSKFVRQAVGVDCVCEPAAILGGRNTQLIMRKTIFPKITVAVAQEKSMWWV